MGEYKQAAGKSKVVVKHATKAKCELLNGEWLGLRRASPL